MQSEKESLAGVSTIKLHILILFCIFNTYGNNFYHTYIYIQSLCVGHRISKFFYYLYQCDTEDFLFYIHQCNKQVKNIQIKTTCDLNGQKATAVNR